MRLWLLTIVVVGLALGCQGYQPTPAPTIPGIFPAPTVAPTIAPNLTEQQTMSVAEYASWCGAREKASGILIGSGTATNERVRSAFREYLDEGISARVPPQLERFHQSRNNTLRAFVGALALFPAGDLFNMHSLRRTAQATAPPLMASFGALPVDIRAVLTLAGCVRQGSEFDEAGL